ncbi:tetratricopeptide repeat protein [Singulisphaera sp. PoT]|uniref:tetratricopeptide repeat protein n=1 Tax=Singulisphaera sp. PoT TaxID=3411797 RepID=UPI003BF54916
MSMEITPARKPRSPKASATDGSGVDRSFWTGYFVDGCLIALFLVLAFLLGVFPLKDTDFWWHLRTGDLIRSTGSVPTHDLYTFTVPDHPWIDLHWIFQVLISWGYEHGGVIALNIAKCIITCASLLFLIICKRREWPVWCMLLAWLPALLVLSGRMYIRPETLTLFYLAAFLGILTAWDRIPWLAFLLPVVQLAWVNTQGLFVLGPILLGFALVDAVFRRQAFAESRKRWWKIVGVSTVLTGLVCFINPYGIRGALYPLELAGTMGNPIFSETIAELTPIPVFIRRNGGWSNLPLQIHVATMVLGALSFVIPMVWTVLRRMQPDSSLAEPEPKGGKSKGSESKKDGKSAKAKRKKKGSVEAPSTGWRLSLFRLLLFAAFSALSWRATRNSHQFAAVVGAITAWNFAEWAGAINARRLKQAPEGRSLKAIPRAATFLTIALMIVLIGSGKFYAWTGEGRIIGLGEEPLWFPHEAVKFCGKIGMPERFLSFHDGYSALYEYHNGPERKTFADARLEVIGPELYERYLDLKQRIAGNASSWPRELDELGRPAVLVGHVDNFMAGASLMANPHWRCVWFDSIAAVFVHESYTGAVQTHTVDFNALHFRPEPSQVPKGSAALIASAKAMWSYAQGFYSLKRKDLARSMILIGLDYTRRIRASLPNSLEGWKLTGQMDSMRDVLSEADQVIPRYRYPFDPVFDLTTARATFALKRANEIAQGDFLSLLLLGRAYEQRGMDEAALPVAEELIQLHPINQQQLMTQESSREHVAQLARKLGTMPATDWSNLGELDQIVTRLLSAGRAGSAADLMERAYPVASRTWEISDRIATLRLHLGEPEKARQIWQGGLPPAKPATRSTRVAMSYLVQDDLDQARRSFHEAIESDPNQFELRYGLAVLEQEAGHAQAAFREATLAEKLAPDDTSRNAARLILSDTRRFQQP